MIANFFWGFEIPALLHHHFRDGASSNILFSFSLYPIFSSKKFSLDLASFLKKGLIGVVALEIAAAGGAFAGFSFLRRSEKSRKYLYQNLPSVVNLYYFAEDSISFGQLVVSSSRILLIQLVYRAQD